MPPTSTPDPLITTPVPPTVTPTPTETPTIPEGTPTVAPTPTEIYTPLPDLPVELPSQICVYGSNAVDMQIDGTYSMTFHDVDRYPFAGTFIYFYDVKYHNAAGVEMRGTNSAKPTTQNDLNAPTIASNFQGKTFVYSWVVKTARISFLSLSEPLTVVPVTGEWLPPRHRELGPVFVKRGACLGNEPTNPVSTRLVKGKVQYIVKTNSTSPFNVTAALVPLSEQNGISTALEPIQIVSVDGSGNYTFTDVGPGNYRITFNADGVKLASSSVEVSVVKGVAAEAPPVPGNPVNYADQGCRKTDLTPLVIAANLNSEDLFRTVEEVTALLPSVAKRLEAKKRRKLSDALGKKRVAAERSYSRLFASSTKLPVVSRVECPAINKCSSVSSAKIVVKYRKELETLKRLGLEAVDMIDAAFKDTKGYKRNKKPEQKIQKAFAKAMKGTKKLPNTYQVCPEKL